MVTRDSLTLFIGWWEFCLRMLQFTLESPEHKGDRPGLPAVSYSVQSTVPATDFCRETGSKKDMSYISAASALSPADH